MKKSLVLLACFSSSVFANSEIPSHTLTQENAPVMLFSVVDTRNKIGKPVGLSYSVSNKHHRLCWTVSNLLLQQQNKVVEVFVSQASTFSSTHSTTKSSKDKKTHTITTMLDKNGESLNRCWRFDKSDPLGNYTLDLRVKDIVFPTQTFELVK